MHTRTGFELFALQQLYHMVAPPANEVADLFWNAQNLSWHETEKPESKSSEGYVLVMSFMSQNQWLLL